MTESAAQNPARTILEDTRSRLLDRVRAQYEESTATINRAAAWCMENEQVAELVATAIVNGEDVLDYARAKCLPVFEDVGRYAVAAFAPVVTRAQLLLPRIVAGLMARYSEAFLYGV